MPAPRGVFALLVAFIVGSATMAAATPPAWPATSATWPPSSGLVVAEVMTGGASASDEYVELANAGSADADLAGCELVYVTASGATTTRKSAFAAPLPLAPGQHLLVANAAGIFAPLADATYSGGLAADGGAVALRQIGGAVIDAVGWGTAANPFVEGRVAPAPPAKASLERLPGGTSGNTQDSNDNLADWLVQPNPVPQSLASQPPPAPVATPSSPAETATAEPTGAPTLETATEPVPTAVDTITPEPTATPDPIPAPISSPQPTAPATATPSARATDAPAPLEPIAGIRGKAVGTRVHVAGLLTAGPGLVGADDLVSIGDESGGVFARLPAAVDGLAIGRAIDVAGTLAAPYGQLEIRDVTSLVDGDLDVDPAAVAVAIADVGEATEGSLVAMVGTVDSVQIDGTRLIVTIGDGAHTVRLLADPPAGLTRSDVSRGDAVVATGIVGQRATATGRLDGYRVWLRRQTDLEVLDPVSMTQDPAPTSPAAATATPVHHDLLSALGTRNASVDVEATTTATAGLLDIGSPTIVVDDGTAAVAVVMPLGVEVPPVGMRVRVTGKIGTWETGPTVLASQVNVQGELAAVAPRALAGPLTASNEWQLVRVCGRIDKITKAGTRWRADLTVDGFAVAVLGEPAAAISVATSAVGRLAAVTGVVRRSTSDSKAFQILPRTALDFHLGPAPEALASAAVRRQTASSGAAIRSGGFTTGAPAGPGIGSIAAYLGRSVTVAGLITTTTAETVTIDDGTGQVRIGGPGTAEVIGMFEPGDAIEVTGVVARDDLGLIVEADLDSIVDLPAGGDNEPAGEAALAGIISAAATATAAASRAAGASIRQASGSAAMPDGATLGLALAILFLAGTVLAMAGRAAWWRQIRREQPRQDRGEGR
jgi:hypothetical protein